jgi:hypothetical protein
MIEIGYYRNLTDPQGRGSRYLLPVVPLQGILRFFPKVQSEPTDRTGIFPFARASRFEAKLPRTNVGITWVSEACSRSILRGLQISIPYSNFICEEIILHNTNLPKSKKIYTMFSFLSFFRNTTLQT